MMIVAAVSPQILPVIVRTSGFASRLGRAHLGAVRAVNVAAACGLRLSPIGTATVVAAGGLRRRPIGPAVAVVVAAAVVAALFMAAGAATVVLRRRWRSCCGEHQGCGQGNEPVHGETFRLGWRNVRRDGLFRRGAG